MKIKSIPENPTITFSALSEIVKIYEKIESELDDKNKMPTSLAYDCGRITTLELFLDLLGVQFETGDQA